jgi:hypothetical protein
MKLQSEMEEQLIEMARNEIIYTFSMSQKVQEVSDFLLYI